MGLDMGALLTTFAYFGQNPMLATRILIDVTGANLLRPFHPAHTRYEHDLEELKRMYPGLKIRRAAIGSAMLHGLIFSLMYSFLYLTYGVVWY